MPIADVIYASGSCPHLTRAVLQNCVHERHDGSLQVQVVAVGAGAAIQIVYQSL